MGTAEYRIHLSIVDEETRRLELEAPHPMIRQVLSTLLETMATSQNGAAVPVPRAAPPAPPGAKPARRPYKRVAPVPPAREKKCSFCSNVFPSRSRSARYCSRRCKRKAHALQQRPTPQATDTVL
jgi:hypothetical protein